MRFVDSNILIYALLKSQRELTSEVRAIKSSAQNILARVEKGEKVITSVVHLSEFVNVLERHISARQQRATLESILSNKNIEIVSVTRESYDLAIELARNSELGINDALAVVIMQQREVSEIYSFDKDYDLVSGVIRLTK
ncbi:MAG: type II toxin-antitoxin system VapC family toxin [Candidatus Micrarchaeota archaeon]